MRCVLRGHRFLHLMKDAEGHGAVEAVVGEVGAIGVEAAGPIWVAACDYVVEVFGLKFKHQRHKAPRGL